MKYFPLVLSLLAAFLCCLLSALGVLPPGVTTGVLVALPLPGLDALWRALAPVLAELRAPRPIELEAEPPRPGPIPLQEALRSSDTMQAPPERGALQELLRHMQAEDNAQTIEARCLAKVGRQRAALNAVELLRAVGAAVLVVCALGLVLVACIGPSTHTAALRSAAARAVALCQADPSRCAQTRLCTAASVRAGGAWVEVARLREADARHQSGSGSPVDLALVSDAERAAAALEASAAAVCDQVGRPAAPPAPVDGGRDAPAPAPAPADMPPHDLPPPRRNDGGDR